MLKEQFEKMKAMVSKEDNGNNKKKIENLVVFIIILIITLIIINYIWNDKEKSNITDESNEQSSYKQLAKEIKTTETSSITTKTDLEQRLEEILSKIEGVGKVNVLITYSQSSEIVAMYNETYKSSLTQEEDSEGRNKKS